MLARAFPCRLVLRTRPLPLSSSKYSTSKQVPEGLALPHLDSPHQDLESFRAYASRVGLDEKSTTYVGTHYEYTSSQSLRRLGFHLKKVGGRSDFGIDLLGTWNISQIPFSMKVLVQCKALARKTSPNVIRELEGAFVGAPMDWRSTRVLGLLVTKNPATKGIRDALARSRWPMGFALCTAEGRLLQLLWNARAEQEGLQGIGVGLRYSRDNSSEKEVHLTWKGLSIKDQT